MIETAGGTERLVLAQVADCNVGKVAPGLLDEWCHLGVVVEADDDDFAETWDAGERL